MYLPSTCNKNQHFILQPYVTRFSTLLIKSSCTMSNSAEVALTVAQDVYEEDHFRIIIEKYGASVKKKKKKKKKTIQKLYVMDYVTGKFLKDYGIHINIEDPKVFNDLPSGGRF